MQNKLYDRIIFRCSPIAGKPASMSSIYDEWAKAEKCVDGIINEYSICHSQEETNPWFMVNLQREHCVLAVNIHIRSSKFI